jgi:hypothetical protein
MAVETGSKRANIVMPAELVEKIDAQGYGDPVGVLIPSED